MLFTLQELLDIVIMTLAVGYLFRDMFVQHTKNSFLFACLVTAPALILHELGHKFTALAFGLSATFHAAYSWLALGLFLKLLRFGFIFFVPAYVSIDGAVSPLQSALVALAGPGVNFILFAASWLLLKRKEMSTRTYVFLQVTKQLNFFLFVFNMLPIPFFDGWNFYSGIYHAFF